MSDSIIMPGTVIEKNSVVEKAIIGERCHVCAGAIIQGQEKQIKVYGNDREIKAEEGAE